MKIALIDLDGVAANDTVRVEFAIARNWPEYFNKARIMADPVWPDVRDLIARLQDEGWTIEYLTGRRSAVRDVTEAWLDANEFPRARVNMREPIWYEDGTLSKSPLWPKAVLAEFKADFMGNLFQLPGVEDVVLFEDDPEVVRVVQRQHGDDKAVLCTWSIKPEAMVKKAIA